MAVNDDAQIPLKVADVHAITDSLNRVIEAIGRYQVPMFMGGPLPAMVLQEIRDQLDKRVAAMVPVALPEKPRP